MAVGKKLEDKGMMMRVSGVQYTAKQIQDIFEEKRLIEEELQSLEQNIAFIYNAKNNIEWSRKEEINMCKEMEGKLVGIKSPEQEIEIAENLNKDIKKQLQDIQEQKKEIDESVSEKYSEVVHRKVELKNSKEKKYGERLREKNDTVLKLRNEIHSKQNDFIVELGRIMFEQETAMDELDDLAERIRKGEFKKKETTSSV